jgi:ATP-dependent protease HslVU (ClpYQ) peptidase subunit
MTCIVGLVDEGKVYIGGDSAGVNGNWDLTVRADSKVFFTGPFLMGFTSSFRMGQLLRYAFVPPPHQPDVDLYRYMTVDFINAVRDCLKTGGWAKKDGEKESGGVFLVGYRGHLFEIESDYQVGEAHDAYMAVGSGDSVALGALYATQKLPPLVRVRLALEAAERWNAGVRGPFVIEVLEPEVESAAPAPEPEVEPAAPAPAKTVGKKDAKKKKEKVAVGAAQDAMAVEKV